MLVKLQKEDIANALITLFTTPGLIEKLGRNACKKALTEHTIEKYYSYFRSITT